jgi:hypothetical protein
MPDRASTRAFPFVELTFADGGYDADCETTPIYAKLAHL